ncbi:hypothetical protein ACFOOK_06260 [Micromonospora krabiensis]|uniref:Uncharacterized protein n=1 Tax=Micromonospora krabiensis TaxID=307121 RepID=A0A1C3NCX7_9ACTN|nr:hypothetical protein [Micromonospora krabiensis]SBV30399.1 hypothetical protein GA0070620_5996 [Micromonospora krabiensis]
MSARRTVRFTVLALRVLVTADGEQGSAPGTRSNTCSAETASAPGGSHAALWVALVRLGRRDGQGPRCESADKTLYQPLNRRTQPLALGDRALYFFDGDPAAGRTVHLSACLGTYLVYVHYSAVGVTDAALADAALTDAALTDAALADAATVVAQEVLSWR